MNQLDFETIIKEAFILNQKTKDHYLERSAFFSSAVRLQLAEAIQDEEIKNRKLDKKTQLKRAEEAHKILARRLTEISSEERQERQESEMIAEDLLTQL